MIRARLLQPALHIIVQSCAIADDDGVHDRGRLPAPSADETLDRVAGKKPNTSCPLRPPLSVSDELDERAAFDRADKRRAAPRQHAFVVRHAGIEIAGRSMKLHRHPNPAAGAPEIDR